MKIPTKYLYDRQKPDKLERDLRIFILILELILIGLKLYLLLSGE